MTINIPLSDDGIRNVINRIIKAKENLEIGVKDLVEALVDDGAEVARAADGSMADISTVMLTENSGTIIAGGDQPIIAEFGAGDATISPSGLFENEPDTPVYPGSYSELVGSGQYAENGFWVFGGQRYTEVEPRQGLHEAKQYIEDSAESIAEEVIKL
ncbi:MAG: hypothetical protein J6Y60_03565 [Treponema sp.]|nr:hypothetical protein [Treponema sp.]